MSTALLHCLPLAPGLKYLHPIYDLPPPFFITHLAGIYAHPATHSPRTPTTTTPTLIRIPPPPGRPPGTTQLVTATSTNPNAQLSAQLSLLGLYAAPTVGDGNCLFRALADQVYGSAALHADVRREVCAWIEAHGERYAGFVEDEGEESSEGGRGKRRGKARGGGEGEGGAGPSKRLQAYLRGMRENATYGGHMELSAFAHMMRRNIKVIQPGLVYVIEWRAGGSSSSSPSTAAAAAPPSASNPTVSADPPSDAATSTPRRRSTRTPSVGGVTPQRKAKHEDKDAQKVRTGHGYYVYEEVTSDEEEGEDPGEDVKEEKEVAALVGGAEVEVDAGPTIYVAYHDWEHFSSIRNLRGPHTGLPNIMETQPQTEDGPSQAEVEKETMKEREREKKRERERKDKERKERSALKVHIKVPSATPEPSAATPAPNPVLQDPALIPLPTSRSASPFPAAAQSSGVPASMQPLSPPARHPLSTSISSSSSSSSSIEAAPPAPAHLRSHSRQPHLQAATAPGARAQYRSPKRTFDESSASGGDDVDGREGREKRSRTRGASMAGEGGGEDDDAGLAAADDMVVDVDGEAEADTPGLSAPGSTASSSETSSEAASEVSSLSASPSPAPEGVAAGAPPPAMPKKAARYAHPHLVQGEKTLTRRQRKALGLPKQRGVAVSAGKIVIPGGRWTGRALPPAAAGGTESEADEEWRRNGNGRLDVRGFRELKI